MQETWVRSLGREDPLEKGMATHSSVLAREIPWTVRGVTKRHDLAINHHHLEILGIQPWMKQVILALWIVVLLPVTGVEKIWVESWRMRSICGDGQSGKGIAGGLGRGLRSPRVFVDRAQALSSADPFSAPRAPPWTLAGETREGPHHGRWLQAVTRSTDSSAVSGTAAGWHFGTLDFLSFDHSLRGLSETPRDSLWPVVETTSYGSGCTFDPCSGSWDPACRKDRT